MEKHAEFPTADAPPCHRPNLIDSTLLEPAKQPRTTWSMSAAAACLSWDVIETWLMQEEWERQLVTTVWQLAVARSTSVS
jgi:hypothetical protein